VCRPLLLIDTATGRPKLEAHHLRELVQGFRTFDDFLRQGLIEYLDVNEEAVSDLCLREPDIVRGVTTHMEIDPMTLLGACAGLIAYVTRACTCAHFTFIQL
jgi:DNA-directed RNA polymerase III subunit RPC2